MTHIVDADIRRTRPLHMPGRRLPSTTEIVFELHTLFIVAGEYQSPCAYKFFSFIFLSKSDNQVLAVRHLPLEIDNRFF